MTDQLTPHDDAGVPGEPPDESIDVAPQTGDGRVDEVLRGLDALNSLPTGDHVQVYDEVHRGLQDALANLDVPAAPPQQQPQ